MGLLEQVTLSGTDSKDKNISKYFYNNAGVQIKMYTGMSSENDTSYLTSKTVNSKDSKKNVSKSYEYDNMGRITKTVSNEITTTTIYDSLGRKYTESEYNKNGYSIFRGYFYEGVSQYVREELTGLYHLLFYSDKTYEYDSEMRVVKVKEAGEETVSYTYDRNGNKKSETLANGVVSTYDYNNANRIVKLVNKKGNSTISSYEYSYYLDGSDACKVTEENGIIETTEYEYDGLKRLTNEEVKKGNTTDTYSYEYDDYGNRSKMTATGSEEFVTEYSYNNAQGKYTALLQKEVKTVEGEENALDLNSNVKQTVYTYDANGNQITKTAEGKTETNTYDGLNQLIGFTDGETTASYKYNASGLRYEKTVDGQTINHVWDGNQQIVADVIDNQFYEADCYIRGTNLVAKYNYWNGDKSEYTYYTQNAHGDVVNLTDKDGKVTKSYRYDAFGVEKNIDENDTNAFRYCGEYFDKETATVYLRARNYNPSIGRFTQRDSFAGKLDDPLSLNLYTYCANNPVYYSDPSGHSAAEVVQGVDTFAETIKNMASCMTVAGATLTACVGAAAPYALLLGSAMYLGNVTSKYAKTHNFDPLKSSSEMTETHKKFSTFSTCENPYLAPWVGSMTIAEIYAQSAAKSASTTDVITKTKTVTQKKEYGYTVYKLVDRHDKSVQYIGRTGDKNATIRRHKRNFSRSELELVPIHEGLSYDESRGLEQYYIETYRTLNKENKANNQINGVNPKNKEKYDYYSDIAIHYLNGETYVGG